MIVHDDHRCLYTPKKDRSSCFEMFQLVIGCIFFYQNMLDNVFSRKEREIETNELVIICFLFIVPKRFDSFFFYFISSSNEAVLNASFPLK